MNKKIKKLKQPLLSDLFKIIGKKLGVKVLVESEWGVVGQISYPNGIKRYFRGTTLDINTMGASEIARDKDYSKIFMKRLGYRVIPWQKFYSDSWAKKISSNNRMNQAWRYARGLGLPVYLKPNSKSQGAGVTKVYSKKEFSKAYKDITKIDNVILVEEAIQGRDYRVVVLDDDIISAYERVPLYIIGDSVHTIQELLKKKQKQFKNAGREKTFVLNDYRIKQTLRRERLTMRSVLDQDYRLQLLNNANLSTGGESKDVTEEIHDFYKKIAINLTHDMGLRLCGVDFIIKGDITTPAKNWYIIEINSAPGLDHYASLGKTQQDIVEALYTKVFIAMGKK